MPAETSLEVEAFWATAMGLHPGWVHSTFRDPIDPDLFPLTAQHWDQCPTGAQRAGLIRLETLIHEGGCWVDSDLQLYKPLTPLLSVPFFATYEDANTVPDFVFGSEPDHPVLYELLEAAIAEIPNGPWASGPGVFTRILPERDVLLLPPQAFAAVHYLEREKCADHKPAPYEFGLHHWAGSWLA